MAAVRLDEGLIDVARALVASADGGEAFLRRAVSTAYYALFHAICDVCNQELVGERNYWDFITPIYRSPGHQSARAFFDRCRSARYFGVAIAEIGEVFVDLQDKRHDADYNPEPFRVMRPW
jgi:hypothetical protein